MSKPSDVRVVAARLYFLPLEMRVPLKFGLETVTSVTCARVCVTVESSDGKRAEGWGETPLSVQWVWPSAVPYAERHERLKQFCHLLAKQLTGLDVCGHAFEIGADIESDLLPDCLRQFNHNATEPMPLLAGLVCL